MRMDWSKNLILIQSAQSKLLNLLSLYYLHKNQMSIRPQLTLTKLKIQSFFKSLCKKSSSKFKNLKTCKNPHLFQQWNSLLISLLWSNQVPNIPKKLKIPRKFKPKSRN
jgi:hypothetical protein